MEIVCPKATLADCSRNGVGPREPIEISSLKEPTQEDPHFLYKPDPQRERKFPQTPSIAEFSNQTVIYLNLSNVVKILSLYQRSYDAAAKIHTTPAAHTRLAVVGEWVDAVLEKYDELSDDSQAVVDMFVTSWLPNAKLAEATAKH